MEGGSKRIFTIVVIALLLGLTIYANRKRLKALFQRRVSKLDSRQKDFIHAVGEHL